MTSTKKNSHDALAHVTAEIGRLLERGVMPWQAPWNAELAQAMTPALPLRSTGQPYKGANVPLLWAAQLSRGYARRTWLTFRQTLELGGHVRKGEKACPVIFYGRAEAKMMDAQSSEQQRTYRFLKLFYVFNVEQCDGLDVPAEPTAPTITNLPALHDRVKRAGAQVRVGGDKAFYAPSVDAIFLPHVSAFLNEGHWTATLAHEAIHFTGHKSRLDRLSDYVTDRKARAREELTAELGAAIIGAMIGLPPYHFEDHATYIADWLKAVRDEPRAFFSAAAKAQAAVDWLMTKAGPLSESADVVAVDNQHARA
jgi:antirestriction protein ArdC